MDAFYASVEQRDHPSLRGKPVAVGHAENGEWWLQPAMKPGNSAYVQPCPRKSTPIMPSPDFVEGRMEVYKQVSAQIHSIFREYTDLIEPISLDEAFLDVTENKKG